VVYKYHGHKNIKSLEIYFQTVFIIKFSAPADANRLSSITHLHAYKHDAAEKLGKFLFQFSSKYPFY